MLWASVAAGDEEGTRLALEQGGRVRCKLMEVGPHDKIKDNTSWKTPLHLAAQMYGASSRLSHSPHSLSLSNIPP